MAPAVLKSIADKAGWKAHTVDLNIKAVKLIEESEHGQDLINFFHHGHSDQSLRSLLYDLFMTFANKLLINEPDVISLSVFTYNCQIATKYLCFQIKKLSPSTKILLGGSGLSNNLIGKSHFAEKLLTNNLIDFYIRGDGEHALLDYLIRERDSKLHDLTDDWKELDNNDLRALPMPDYDDYDFSEYDETSAVPVLGSRGCVRSCSFCDVHAHWKKFSWRTGEHIFLEMLELHKKYGTFKFKFQDSLINGNLKEYRNLMSLISKHNEACEKDKKWRWGSFFILRSRQHFTEQDWTLTAAGGGVNLMVGIETFNDQARFHLGKKFTNNDIEFSIEQAVKNNITLILLFFTGYVTETESDNEFALSWFENHAKYKDNLIINLGTPLGILPGTPLMQQFDDLGLIRTGPTDQDWSNPSLGNTPAKRIQWHQRLQKKVSDLGYQQVGGADNHFILENMMKNLK